MKKVAVVILNYNGKGMLEIFLPTLFANTDPEIADIVVADNASTDDSVAFMQAYYPFIRLIVNPFNGGFATGYNLAFKKIEAKYYVLLNSDIEVTPDWLLPIVELMDSDDEIAACQPKIRSYYEKEKFEYAGASGGFIDKFGYPFCRGRLFQNIEVDNGQYDAVSEVFWATGACLIVRADVYRQFGGLDDSFFAHMEEIDFCWRIKNHGYKVYCCPQSVVFHIGGGTLPKKSPRKTFLNFRNNLSLLLKNLPQGTVFVVLVYRLFLDWIAAIKFMVDGSFADFWAVIRAHFAFFARIPSLVKVRKTLKHGKVGEIYRHNIVFDNYLRGVKMFSQLNPSAFSTSEKKD